MVMLVGPNGPTLTKLSKIVDVDRQFSNIAVVALGPCFVTCTVVANDVLQDLRQELEPATVQRLGLA